MAHTKGPWHLVMEPDGDMEEDFPGHYVGGFSGECVYTGGGIFAVDNDMPKEAIEAGEDPVIMVAERVYDEDDARLMAASPEMLAQLERLSEFEERIDRWLAKGNLQPGWYDDFMTAMEETNILIAKAKGN